MLDKQYQRLSKLSTIIGRYKGGMEVFSDQIRYFALNCGGIDEYQKRELCRVADMMNKLVTENEALWDEAYGITKKDDDIVELERAETVTQN
jgi:hypothetical protein